MPNQTIDTSMYGGDLDLPGDARYPGVIYSDKRGINLYGDESPENIQKLKNIPFKQLGPTFVRQMIGPDGITYYDFDKDDEESYIDPNRIPRRIQKSVPMKMGMLEKLRNRFYKPATTGAGGYNVSQLNQMNALGGYYSEPARQQRQKEAAQINILNRAAENKAVGNVNKLLGQYGYSGTLGSGTLQFTGTPQGDQSQDVGGYSRSDDSWSSSTFRKGGLATLWPR